jgi:hypothetical protein
MPPQQALPAHGLFGVSGLVSARLTRRFEVVVVDEPAEARDFRPSAKSSSVGRLWTP